MAKNTSFLAENGELDLSTEKQLVEFLAAVLKRDIILDEPHTFAEMLLATEVEEDEIFVDEDTSDTILLRDDENRWYITPSGRTRLPFPILQSDLDNLNILKIRPATDSEVEDFIEKNNL